MKRIILFVLAAVLLLSVAACTKKPADVNPPSATEAPTDAPTDVPTDAPTDAPAADTLGKKLDQLFLTTIQADPTISLDALANAILAHSDIQFAGMTMAVTEGYLNGFSADVTGFSEGVSFGPMSGSIPFIGYLFVLADGADSAAFMEQLKTNANLNWNICVSADELVVDSYNNTIFVVMCPNNFED